ncbi:kinase-like domain-containing protein [Boletus edulis BED1]|uniref:Kinase-like domain-containing protein n=1 Tax=Boletus edulis BED1 TaxID=1328754 RepID=A0AAD4GCI4_BOLED|nr:kinase-like domain-containing protein [Boletus edulis BED1]
MPTNIIGPTLGAAQLAATLSGVPFAAGGVMVLQLIHAACSQVSVHKQKSAQLVQRCTTLLTFINEQSSLLVGTDATASFDEAEAVLASVHRRVQKWAHCGKVKVLLNSAQIARDLDKCYADVDNAMERLHVANPVAMLRMQQRSIDMMKHHQAALEETLQQLLISPREIERAVQQHISGGNAAYELMRLGQERLVGLREEAPVPSATYLSDGRQVVESPTSSRPPSPITTVQNQIEQALLDLHRLTNIPPTIPILNNQVKKTDLTSVRGGPYSQIFEGRWLGEKKVALKTLRIVDEHDPKAKRLQLRFEHEISVWSKLKHENVLTMLGVVTNMGSIHIVSPWQLDNVRNYRRENPDVNPLNLLIQAAKGLEYLHSQQIVHGHLKCTNMLVSEEGVVTLSDFGLTQVLTDVVGKMAMVVLTNTSAVRWHAPELNQGEDTTPTMASDVFAFGMSVLELLTMKPPYSNRRRDVSVIRDLTLGVLPPRPDEPEVVPWMSDSLWEMLNTCWKWNPEERLLAKELPSFLASESSSQL